MESLPADSAFERERLRFCERIYELERLRAENIERKAQIYLTLLTLLLGAVSLRIDSWGAIRQLLMTMWHHHPVSAGLIVIEAILCAGAIASSLLFVALVFQPRSREKVYPRNPVDRLFTSSTAAGGEPELMRDNAERYARAVEENNRINTSLSRWLVRAAFMTVASLFLFGILLATLLATYMTMSGA